jgi:hypothetical protein
MRRARGFPACGHGSARTTARCPPPMDFKEVIRICGIAHRRTSRYYPQSNGKNERWYKILMRACIRVTTPVSLQDARGSSRISLRITTGSDYTVPSARSHRRTSWPVARRSFPDATASSIWSGTGGEQLARRLEPPSNDDRTGHCPSCRAALRRG